MPLPFAFVSWRSLAISLCAIVLCAINLHATSAWAKPTAASTKAKATSAQNAKDQSEPTHSALSSLDHNCRHNLVLWVDPATNLDYPQRSLVEAAEQIFCADEASEREALRQLRAQIRQRKPISSISNSGEARLMVVPVKSQRRGAKAPQVLTLDSADALAFGNRGEVFYRRHIYRIDRKLVEQAYLPLRDEGDLRQSQANELREPSRRPAALDSAP
ncbi:MAG TPA: hypothetical protein PLZ57_10550 [Pseudobdellovibrionaceae bacterium]|nr:hypothetical protein [Pseudobdellovibrionaceae bacterium]